MDDGDWSTTNDAKALDVDADGSIVVAGLTRDDSDNTDAYLVRYDADGRRMWTVRYNSPSNAADWISVVRAAPDGSTYAAGDSFHKGWNALSLKIDNDGNVLWLRHDRAEDSYVAEASLIDDAGNFYFAGTVYPGTMLLQKISGDGDLLWTVGTAGAAAKMMAWESSGDLVVAGKIAAADEYSDATNDIFLAKYAPDGDLRWTAEFKEFGESESGATGLAIEEDGSIVVSGGSQRADDPSAHDALMLSYRPDGAIECGFYVDDAVTAYRSSVAPDAGGGFYLAGQRVSETGGVDIWLSKVDLSGSCDGCLIDNICYPPGKPEPGNVCAICDPDQSSDAWTPRDGIACNDGLFCTGIDFCRDGACADHSGDPCAPESCDEEYNCCGNCWFGDDDHDDGDPVDDDTVASADDDSAVPSDDDAVESDVTKSDAACCGA